MTGSISRRLDTLAETLSRVVVEIPDDFESAEVADQLDEVEKSVEGLVEAINASTE